MARATVEIGRVRSRHPPSKLRGN